MATRAWPWQPNCHLLWDAQRIIRALCVLTGLVAPLLAAAAEVERLDGSTITCSVIGADASSMQFECPAPISLALDELRSVTFSRAAAAAAAPGSTVFHLADGGRMRGTITGEGSESVVAETPLGAALDLPFSSLAGLWFGGSDVEAAARLLFAESLANRLAGKDILVTRRDGEVAAIRGSITDLGPRGGHVRIGKTDRPFSLENVAGIVFAIGLADAVRWPVSVGLIDGTGFAGRLLDADGETMRFGTPFGAEVAVRVERVGRLRFQSDRVVYLSDLTPKAEKAEGVLFAPSPARIDRSVANRPLAVDGEAFDRGIGVHAPSALTYALDGAYASFAGRVGIDDAVRPRGSVVFRVDGDGRRLFESEVVTGRDRARSFAVDVRGVATLVLSVDCATDMDLSDHADWCDVRLIKPAASER